MAPRVFWVDAPLKGRLAIMPKPLGGERLDDEIATLRAQGIGTILSLLEPDEAAELDLSCEDAVCTAHDVQFLSFPIADRGLPEDQDAFADLTSRLQTKIAAGGTVAIHCRAGIGRTSLAAASVLVKSGIAAMQALTLLSQARGLTVPDTEAQRDWILSLRPQGAYD